MAIYKIKTEQPDYYEEISQAAHEWVVSDESMMTARKMADNVVESIDATFNKWQPRHAFEFIKVEPLDEPIHFVKHVIAQ